MSRVKLAGPAYSKDPFAALRALRAQGDVTRYKIPILGNVWMTTRYDAARDMLKQTDTFCMDGRSAGKNSQMGIAWMPKTIRLLGENMLGQDAPTHRRLRKLSDEPFRRINIDTLRPRIMELCEHLLDEMSAQARPDFVTGFARPLPLLVISEMLGLPLEDRPRFIKWMEPVGNAGNAFGMLRFLPMLGRIKTYLIEQFDRCRKAPRPGLISELVHAADGEDRLSEDELLAMVFVLFFAGHETTTHLLSSSLWTLLRGDNVRDEFMSAAYDRNNAVDELLRYNSPVGITKPRFVREDISFHGASLKRGERIMASLASANTDPNAWENPETLDFKRSPIRHLTFGNGPHICLGLHLARAEAEIGLAQVFERWPGLKPAIPLDEMAWIPRIGIRGLKALPIQP